MANIDWYLNKYGENHQNPTNKRFHWICVPSIIFSLFGMLYAIPFPFAEKGLFTNWATLFYLFSLIYYLRLSIVMAFTMALVAGAMLWGVHSIYQNVGESSANLALVSLGIFVVAWIGQFIGHKIEGKKPSFFEDVQFLLIGPIWLLHFIYKKIGISY